MINKYVESFDEALPDPNLVREEKKKVRSIGGKIYSFLLD